MARRVVVAFDASPHSMRALEAAAELAATWDGELDVIFVEDANLLRWASLPFAHQVGSYSAAAHKLEASDLERQWQSQATRARRAMSQVVSTRKVRATFRVARGSVAQEILAKVSESDVLSLGKGAPGRLRPTGLGSTAREIASRPRGRVLFLPQGASLTGPIAAVYEGGERGAALLRAAAELLGPLTRRLLILCLDDPAVPREQCEASGRSVVEPLDVAPRFHYLLTHDPREWPHAARTVGAKLLVLPGTERLVSAEQIQWVVNDFDGAVLIVGEH